MSSVQLDDEVPFWKNPTLILTVIPAILGVLRIFGFISEDQVSSVNDLVKNLVENAFLFGTSIVALIQWFKQDTAVKVEKMAMKREEVRLQTEQLRVEQLRMNLKA